MIWWEEALVIDDRLVPLRGHLDEEVCDLVLILLQIYIYIYTHIYMQAQHLECHYLHFLIRNDPALVSLSESCH